MIYIAILSFFINLLTTSLSCMPNHCCDSSPCHMQHLEEEEFGDYLDSLDCFGSCNFTLINPKAVINPYKSQMLSYVPQKPFGSFYQKCAVCVAVASEISRIVEKISQETDTISKTQDKVNEDIAKNISDLCSKGFKNYDLRRYYEKDILTDNLKCTEHVSSNMDGIWTKKLREMCNLYTTHMDLKHVSNNYANKTDEIILDLCMGTGIFRDCLSVEENPPLEAMQELKECSSYCQCGELRMNNTDDVY